MSILGKKKKEHRGQLRRFFTLCIMLFMLVSALAGCGKSEDQAAGQQTVQQEVQDDTQQAAEPADAAVGQDTDQQAVEEQTDEAAIDEDGSYTSKEDVALYLHTYGRLPSNFMTKKEAKQLGWEGGSLEDYAPGKCIGGDRFGNYEGVLPDGSYKECDIGTLGKSSRGAKRIVYSDDGRIYYTDDHYETFEQLY